MCRPSPVPLKAAAALLFLLGCCSLLLLGWSQGREDRFLLERERYLMGTICRLSLQVSSRRQGLLVSERLLAIIERTEEELSPWRAHSWVSALNRQPLGEPFPLQRDSCLLLRRVLFWAGHSGGAFNPCWEGGVPCQAVLDLDEACRVLRLGSASFDPGAFGKGEALRRVQEQGGSSPPGLIDFGGQLMVLGPPPQSWRVQVAHPRRRLQPLFSLNLRRGSLATSANTPEEEGGQGTHIRDPFQGTALPLRGAVVVWHPSPLLADIFSTALFVMGPQRGLPWARRRDLAVCFLLEEGEEVRLLSTPRFREEFPEAGRVELFPAKDL